MDPTTSSKYQWKILILPNDGECISCCHFYLLRAFPQYLLNQQLSDAYSMANAVQYIEISEMIKTLPHPQEALNLLENQNHLLPQAAWILTTKVTYSLYSHS